MRYSKFYFKSFENTIWGLLNIALSFIIFYITKDYIEFVMWGNHYRLYDLHIYAILLILSYVSWEVIIAHLFMIVKKKYFKYTPSYRTYLSYLFVLILAYIYTLSKFFYPLLFSISDIETVNRLRFWLLLFILMFQTNYFLYKFTIISQTIKNHNSSEEGFFKSILHQIHYLIVMLSTVIFCSYTLVFNSLRIIYNLNYSQDKQLDSIITRKMWWCSLSNEWRDVYRTVILENYLPPSLLSDFFKNEFNLPILPSDDLLNKIIDLKLLHLKRDTYTQNPFDWTPRTGNKHFKVSNLIGLDMLANIEYLDISRNSIRNLNLLKKHQKIKYLDCSNNMINDITPLCELSNLETLIIYNNPIQDWSQLDSLKVKTVIKTEEEYCKLIK